MIVDSQRLTENIALWLKTYALRFGRGAFIINFDGTINSIVVAILCKRSGISTICVSQKKTNKLFDISASLGLVLVDSHIDARAPAKDAGAAGLVRRPQKHVPDTWVADCLHAVSLHYFAKRYYGLVAGLLDRNDHFLIRNYDKLSELSDVLPIADLYNSEVVALFEYLTDGKVVADNHKTHTDPTQDEIERIDRENERNGIIYREDLPSRHEEWFKYPTRLKTIITHIHGLEKTTRHKNNNAVAKCELRNKEGLVK